MAIKRNSADLARSSEKKSYFNSDYGFKKRTGMALGVDAYVIMLDIENGYFETPSHKVQGRKVNGQDVGFRSKFSKNIACRGVDAEGNRIEGAVCCQLAQDEKDRVPEKENSNKRMIGFSNSIVHIPVLVLSNSDTDTKAKKVPPTKLSLQTWDFTYLEFTRYQYDNILAKFKEDLINDGIIDVELEGPELYDRLLVELSTTVLKVSGVESKSPNIAYERSYSFISFENPVIGKVSGEHDAIVGFKSNKEIKNGIADFITLFDSKVDELVDATYTDEELIKYIKNDTERLENVEECLKKLDKEEQVVEETKEEITTSEEEAIVDEELETLLNEEDVSFDIDDEDLFDEED